MQKVKKGLGRGLNALITTPVENENSNSGVLEIDINKIEPNINQPRKNFDEDSLIELAESIKNFGIIQPLILKDEGDYYTIIAGERRWRAGRIAKIPTVPAIIKDYNEMETIQIALIENLQRQDLNPIEEAECYRRLSEEFFFSQEDIANKLGKKRTVISYYLSLLNLDGRVQNFISEGKLTVGHGRAMLAIDDKEKQFIFSEQVIEENLTIRQSEFLIKNYIESKENKDEDKEEEIITPIQKSNEDNNKLYKNIEYDLKTILGTNVSIKNGKKKGRIEIEYYSEEDLDRLISIFKNIS